MPSQKSMKLLELIINKFFLSKHTNNVISKITKAVNVIEKLESVLRGITGQIMKDLHVVGVSSVIKYVSPV